MQDNDASRQRARRRQLSAWHIALDFTYGVIGMTLLGLLIDYLAGTSPIGLIVGAVLGLIGGSYRFATEAIRLVRSDEAPQRPRPPPPPPPRPDLDHNP